MNIWGCVLFAAASYVYVKPACSGVLFKLISFDFNKK